jgi:hypothetical protein
MQFAFPRLTLLRVPEYRSQTKHDSPRFLSRPVYRFRSSGRIAVVYADSGEVFHGFQEEQARQVGAPWTDLRPEDARLETRQIQEDDQWTVQQHYRAYRPLWKFSWPDGDETYVSDLSGEVVQYTTRHSRLGAYFGAIPHWIHITQLRRNATAWSRALVLISGALVDFPFPSSLPLQPESRTHDWSDHLALPRR